MATHSGEAYTNNYQHRWRYLVQFFLDSFPLTPLRIALIYTVFGFVALFASDVLLVIYVSEPLLSQLQAVKGGGEIIVTAGLIFVLSRGYQSQLTSVNVRLNRQREELEILHRVLRHNLRNNLNKILGYTDMIDTRNGFSAECAQIIRAVDQLDHYTEQASRINRVTRRDDRATFDLPKLIPRLISEHKAITDAAVVTVDMPEGATVEANHMFPDAVAELITNAITHNDSDTPRISIEVDPDHRPLMTAIRITDNGPGIPESEAVPVQERREDPLSHPSGMGLWFVDWTAEHSDGEFSVHRNAAGGTTAELLVPTALDGMEALTSGALWRV